MNEEKIARTVLKGKWNQSEKKLNSATNIMHWSFNTAAYDFIRNVASYQRYRCRSCTLSLQPPCFSSFYFVVRLWLDSFSFRFFFLSNTRFHFIFSVSFGNLCVAFLPSFVFLKRNWCNHSSNNYMNIWCMPLFFVRLTF